MSKSNGYGEIEVIEATPDQRAMAELRPLVERGDLEGVQALASGMVTEQAATEQADRKSQVIELIEQAKPGEPVDWAGIAGAAQIEAEYHRPAPTLRDFLANTTPDIAYFVDGMIMENAKVYLASEPKHGKSFFTMYLALCAASGKPFFDREVKACPVMMIDQENNKSLNHWRMYATARGLGLSQSLPDLPIMPLFHEGINLADDASIERLKRYIADFKPGLITVDSLIRCTRGLGENVSDDMNEVAHVVSELSRDTGQDFVFLFLHHTKKDKEAIGQERVRGSGDIMAMVDHGFMLEKVTEANDAEKFGLTETSVRHGTGVELEYRLMVNETTTGDMVKFIESTDPNIHAEGASNGEEELDTSGL